jgi:hypothetical protein
MCPTMKQTSKNVERKLGYGETIHSCESSGTEEACTVHLQALAPETIFTLCLFQVARCVLVQLSKCQAKVSAFISGGILWLQGVKELGRRADFVGQCFDGYRGIEMMFMLLSNFGAGNISHENLKRVEFKMSIIWLISTDQG